MDVSVETYNTRITCFSVHNQEIEVNEVKYHILYSMVFIEIQVL